MCSRAQEPEMSIGHARLARLGTVASCGILTASSAARSARQMRVRLGIGWYSYGIRANSMRGNASLDRAQGVRVLRVAGQDPPLGVERALVLLEPP